MNMRAKILQAAVSNPGLSLQEITDATNEKDVKRVRANVDTAVSEKLLTRKLDEITRHPGYYITDTGRKRLAAHKGGNATKDKASGNVTLTDEGKTNVQVAATREVKSDAVVTVDHFNGFDPARLPPILISCAARLWPGSEGMFWEQCIERMPDRIQEMMRDAAELHAARKVIADHDRLSADLANAQALASKLQTLLDSSRHECEALRSEAERHREDGAEAIDLLDAASGYLVKAPKRKPRFVTKPESARNAAMACARNGSGRGDVYALVHVGTAKRGAEWSEARELGAGTP